MFVPNCPNHVCPNSVHFCPKMCKNVQKMCPSFVPNGRFIKYPTKCAKFGPGIVPALSRGWPPLSWPRGAKPPRTPPYAPSGTGPTGPSSGSPPQAGSGGHPLEPPESRLPHRQDDWPPRSHTHHAVAKLFATLHAWWAGPDHPPGLLHRSDERSESRGSMLEGGSNVMLSPCYRQRTKVIHRHR